MALKSQTDFLTTLAYLMGERTVNSTTSASRAVFIQETLNEAYAAYPWRFARTNATLVFSNGVATLPTNYDDNHQVHLQTDIGGDYDLNPIDPDNQVNALDGNLEYWLEALNDGDTYVIKSNESNLSTATARYQKRPPELDSAGTIKTPYPNKMTIALGARRYVKLGQNPDSDISQDQAIFEKDLAKDIASQQVAAPRKRRRRTGGFSGDW